MAGSIVLASRSFPALLAGVLSLPLRTSAQTCPGEVASEQKISETAGGFGGALDNDLFGHSVVALGDLDGDGTGELAVSAPADDDGGAEQGAVWILFLGAGGTVQSEQKISETAGGFGGDLGPADRFGYSLAALGDLDGDGIEDLAVGAPFDDTNQGALWILFLDTDGTVKSEQKISETSGGFGSLLDDDGRFGGSVAALGDLDGDGIGDVAVGANNDDDGGTNRGAVWILFLDTDGSVKSEQKISASAGAFAGVLDDGDNFGYSLSSLGNLDGDGIQDLAVGAWQDDDGGLDRGAVWILFLDVDGTVQAQQKISATAGGFTGPLDNGDNFGASVSALGDADADGVIDLAVGAPNDDDGGSNQGAAWILFLAGDGTVQSQQKISALAGGFGGDLDPFDIFGYSVSGVGDVDGDGTLDLAVGAPQDDDGGADQGAAWILFLGDDTPPVLTCPPVVVALAPKAPPQALVVQYSVGVTDNCDAAPSLVCVPPSGSLFPWGTTSVTCTATDASGNQSMCTFPVIVQSLARRAP